MSFEASFIYQFQPSRRDGRSTVARMDSFLTHEVEAEKVEALVEVESRCSALNAELSEVRFAYNQAVTQLEELQKRLADYDTIKEKLVSYVLLFSAF